MDENHETQEQAGQHNDDHNDDLDELNATIQTNMRSAKTASAEWRTDAREDFDFSAGRQWSAEDIAVLNEQRRPPVVFNRISRTINAVVGLEISNRQEVRFIPRETSDSGYNEMLTDTARWVRDQCDAEDEETESFTDVVTCGMGWTETRIDYDDDPDGMIFIDHVDPLTMFWDPSANKRNLGDARWFARVKRMSKAEVLELWPGYEGGQTSDTWLDETQEPHDASPPYYEENEDAESQSRDIEVIHYQWYEREKFVRVQSENGEISEFTEDRFAQVKETIDGMGLQYVEQRRKQYKYAFSIGGKVYETDDLAIQDGFTLKCITGMRDRNMQTWFGLVAIMKDPQRWANKWLSQVMHIMNSNAKGGVLAEIGAFVSPKKAEADWAKPDAFIAVKTGGLQKIQERQQANFPTGFQELMKYAVESISDTPGVNMELMGLVGKEQSGVLESMRKQAGVTLLAVFFDALRRYRKEQGRILAAFIREYISDGRLVRIVGREGAKYVPLMRDQVSFKYDVVVDEAPTSHNQKEKVMAILLHLVPAMIQNGMPPPPPEILEYLPVPQSLMEKWLAQTRPDPQQQAAQAQAQQEERAIVMMERKAKATRDQAEADKAMAEAAKITAEAQHEGDNTEIIADMQSEREKASIRAGGDIEVAKIRGMVQVEIERMKLMGHVPDESVLQNLETIVNGTMSQMDAIKSVLMTVSQAVAASQDAVLQLQKPKKRHVKVLRDEDGNMIGAEILDDETSKLVQVGNDTIN